MDDYPNDNRFATREYRLESGFKLRAVVKEDILDPLFHGEQAQLGTPSSGVQRLSTRQILRVFGEDFLGQYRRR